MTSRDEVKVGQSVLNLIAGVEDVLRLAAPARDQMIGLQSYMKQLVSVNAGIKKEAYQGLHTDNFPLSENDNPDAVFAEVERVVGFAKEELLRIQAVKNNKIRELENERRELQENAKRTEEVQRRQIQELQENAKRTEEEQRRQIQELQEYAKRTEEVQRRQSQELQENAKMTEEEQRRQIQKISDENDQLKNTAANQVAQNQKIHELENEKRKLQEKTKRTVEEQRRQIQKLSDENDQLKQAAAYQAADYNEIRELENESRKLHKNAQKTVEEQHTQIQTLSKEIDELKMAAENQRLLMEQNTKLFMEHREKLFQENEKLQGDLSILSRSITAADSSHGEDLQKLQVVCELYSKLYTNIWPSAFKQGKLIFNGYSDHMIIKAIQEVLEEVFQLANEECERQWKELERALKMQSKNELYPDHKDAIRRLRWTTVQFVVDTVSQMWHKIRADLRGFARQIQPFVDECARIGCLMSLHEPRIVIMENARSGTDVNENVYDKLSPEGNTVEFVVWPALMITNGHVIAKGVVQCYRADPRHNLWQTHSSVV